jgi:hypothetical protein
METTKVVTGKVRFCYLSVFEPKPSEDGKDKFQACILIPKSDKDTLSKINKAIEAAKAAGKSQLADKNGRIPATVKTPLRDGDEDHPDDPAFKNMMFMNASSLRRPTIVDRNLDEILDKEEFYSGCWGRASVNFFAYNSNGNKGIGVGLNNLQKLKDDENLMGVSSAKDDFGGENEWGDDDADDMM